MSNFKLNRDGVKTEILQSSWMKDYVEKEAKKRSGSDSHVKTFIGYDRAKAIIYPDTKEYK